MCMRVVYYILWFYFINEYEYRNSKRQSITVCNVALALIIDLIPDVIANAYTSDDFYKSERDFERTNERTRAYTRRIISIGYSFLIKLIEESAR